MNYSVLKSFFISSFIYSISCLSQEDIKITYIGNMGVHISDGQSSILIDGLHTKYGDDYLFPTKEVVHKINTELNPNAILFTHYHGDHFSPQLSEVYLKSHKKAILFGPNQIINKFAEFTDRIVAISTKDYTKQPVTVKNFMITGVKINHVGKRHTSVENIGYIVHINNKKILHVGDTDWFEEINLFHQLHLVDEGIDIAIIPYWMLLSNGSKLLIKKYINPKQVIATHISPLIKKTELIDLKNKYPNIHFLTTLEQQIHL
ncbi:MBL fold metallo-hydrolase [Aquimarina longa]|uniref:MBL fold metallo-hydrolase n=1 Tax=Aquimarina longa TaxID=1080221 RepID=UPI0007836F55|nr:MBL fold metallo-hydrolase [Aquimarina longa]